MDGRGICNCEFDDGQYGRLRPHLVFLKGKVCRCVDRTASSVHGWSSLPLLFRIRWAGVKSSCFETTHMMKATAHTAKIFDYNEVGRAFSSSLENPWLVSDSSAERLDEIAPFSSRWGVVRVPSDAILGALRCTLVTQLPPGTAAASFWLAFYTTTVFRM